MVKVHSWHKRAGDILADDFDIVNPTALVQEIRSSAGLSSSLRFAADQALISLQAAKGSPENKWLLAVAKQRFEMLRSALVRASFRA